MVTICVYCIENTHIKKFTSQPLQCSIEHCRCGWALLKIKIICYFHKRNLIVEVISIKMTFIITQGFNIQTIAFNNISYIMISIKYHYKIYNLSLSTINNLRNSRRAKENKANKLARNQLNKYNTIIPYKYPCSLQLCPSIKL